MSVQMENLSKKAVVLHFNVLSRPNKNQREPCFFCNILMFNQKTSYKIPDTTATVKSQCVWRARAELR